MTRHDRPEGRPSEVGTSDDPTATFMAEVDGYLEREAVVAEWLTATLNECRPARYKLREDGTADWMEPAIRALTRVQRVMHICHTRRAEPEFVRGLVDLAWRMEAGR